MRFGEGYGQWVMGGDGARGRGGRGSRHGGGSGHGGGRRRMFDGEELKRLLLVLVAETPRHGYDVIREIEARSGGAYAPSPGVVYPTLTLLDEMGWIEQVEEAGARRRFSITAEGRAELGRAREQVEAVIERLAALQAERARTDRAPVRRAMGGLHMAVGTALGEAQDDGERGHAIAAILDEAAQRIERL